jgi:hypothetical protein
MPKITKRSVDALVAGALIWDDELPGFGARRRESGATYYFLKYRVGARQRWYTIGRHGAPWTPEGPAKKRCDFWARLFGAAIPVPPARPIGRPGP